MAVHIIAGQSPRKRAHPDLVTGLGTLHPAQRTNGLLDVLVLGKGPAGLAAAAALAEQGLAVGLLGPAGPVRWPAQYGAWTDELAAVGYPDIAGHQWPETIVALGNGKRRILPHGYARIDKDLLAERLVGLCDRGGVRWFDGRGRSAEHRAAESVVRCESGSEISARVVIDATGHRPALLQRKTSPAQSFQTAFGLTFEAGETPFDPAQAVLMDWDQSHLRPGESNASAPSFLYAMPLGDGLLFAEETVLAARPAVPVALLEHRLRLRLAAHGIEPGRIVAREKVWIPMGGPIPQAGRTIGFGGAAGMVHPATGYLLTSVLEAAPRLASALAAALGANGAGPDAAADAAWAALWPADRRRRRELFCFGMEVLLRLDARQIQSFFGAFFELPAHDWQGYLHNRLPATELAAVMIRVFARVPGPVRAAMVRSVLGANGLRLVSTLVRIGAR